MNGVRGFVTLCGHMWALSVSVCLSLSLSLLAFCVLSAVVLVPLDDKDVVNPFAFAVMTSETNAGRFKVFVRDTVGEQTL